MKIKDIEYIIIQIEINMNENGKNNKEDGFGKIYYSDRDKY